MLKRSRLAIMGGTFDPVHYGHLLAAESARYQFDLEKVVFIPAGQPPHKDTRKISDPAHRLTMTKLAVATNPAFMVSSCEVDREGPSYTVETVKLFVKKYIDYDIFFIAGADAILEIITWERVEQLLAMCKFIAVTRPGYNLGELKNILQSRGLGVSDNILKMEIPLLEISSTDIRKRIMEGRPVKYMLPESVEKYIYDKELYR